MALPRQGMNEYVHSSEDVEKQFTAMMDTYLDSWIPADALPNVPRNVQQRSDVGSQPEIQALKSQGQTLNSNDNLRQHAYALSSFTSPSDNADLDAELFGLGLDVRIPALELEAPAGQASMLTAMSCGNATGTTGGNAPVPGTEGVRKQKILEKNRRAQKRFREKQKAKMADMEVELQDIKSTMATVVKEKTCLKRQNESLLKALEMRQNQIEALSEVAQVNPDGASEPDLGEPMRAAAGTLSSQLEPSLTLEACRKMSPSSAITQWRTYVERLTSVLVEAEMPAASDAIHASLRQTATHASKFAHVLAIVNPHAIKILMNSNLDSGDFMPDVSQTQGEEFWAETIDVISLTQEQTEKILYLASMLVKSIKSCHSQREVLSRKLTSLLPQTFGTSGDVGAACSATHTMGELRKNFQSEHVAWTTFVAGVVANILSHRQFARLCSRCYPYFPRTFQIARHLAKGKDILELTGLPGFLMPAGSKTDIGGSQDQQDAVTGAPAAESTHAFAMSRYEGSRKSARTGSVLSGTNNAGDKS